LLLLLHASQESHILVKFLNGPLPVLLILTTQLGCFVAFVVVVLATQMRRIGLELGDVAWDGYGFVGLQEEGTTGLI